LPIDSYSVLSVRGEVTLFNKRNYAAAERFWSPNYIQHSAQIESGRDGLFNLIKAAPASLKHEPGVILAEGDYVIVHGRFLPERNKQFTKRCSDKSLYPGRYRCNLTRQPYRNCLYKRFTGLTELAGSNFRRCLQSRVLGNFTLPNGSGWSKLPEIPFYNPHTESGQN
jgi:hypothetical protein